MVPILPPVLWIPLGKVYQKLVVGEIAIAEAKPKQTLVSRHVTILGFV
jgi:hypothetical protein